ncbi:MAG: MarR family winged helix-turn-helix transcriptional regulator [Actinomycetota bacterium]
MASRGDEPQWLDEQQQRAWRALLVVLNRAMPEIERTLKEHDLLSIQYGMLVALAEAPESTRRLSDLAEDANMSQSRLSHRIRDLVENGDIEVDNDTDDGRVKLARLTPKGRRRLERLAPLHVADVRRLLFDHLDERQTAALAEALGTVAGGLCDHDEFRT